MQKPSHSMLDRLIREFKVLNKQRKRRVDSTPQVIQISVADKISKYLRIRKVRITKDSLFSK